MLGQEKKKKEPDLVKRIQEVALAENERKKKADEEAKKKKGTVSSAPSDGILKRMYDSWMGTGSKDKEKK